ncbi:hypothetical protein [Cryobacterium sp. Sr3]|uniref:hypothetical protein n=1 Tax=Cryobacterium sp. Sr3 TaxID=1259194 RepID=UPI00106A892A|nr:hypothetical protein [Cryobacterium sp. Sr3]TFB61015.1 hypothetical protein E3N94_00685 [Cryobacterium sp. Sr3]
MAPHIAGIDAKLAAAGYTPGTRRGMLKIVGDVGRWLNEERLTAADFDESAVAPFRAARAGARQVGRSRPAPPGEPGQPVDR